MAKNTKSQEGSAKIAAFVQKYSNAGSGASYKSSIEGFLRCIYGLPRKDANDKKIAHDYEGKFNQYLSESRDKIADITAYSECLVRECASKQSARQQITYTVKFLRAHGVNILKDDVQDIKREAKGGAATIDKVMDHKVICNALKGSDARSRALILTLASSGARIGEVLSLKTSDIDLNTTPAMITIRYSKNGQSRYTFVSNEARDAILEYLKVRAEYMEYANNRAEKLGNAPRADTGLLFPITDASVNKMWETMLKNAGLYTRDERSNRNQYRIHSLRKFFISQLSMAGARTLAEHLAGHTGYLDASYRQVSPEFAAREYQKLQSVLTVCIPESIKNGIKMADEKISILMEKTEMQSTGYEGMKIQNQQLREQMTRQSEEISEIKSTLALLSQMMKNQTPL